MGLYLNLGNMSFQNYIKGEFIDKSPIISEFNKSLGTQNKLICISRPRRFGKSLLAKMLCAYYDRSCKSEQLFEGLKITKSPDYKTYLNHYPVLYLDITWFISTCTDIDSLLSYMQKEIIREIKAEFPQAQGENLPVVLASASDIYNTKFVIIIDEWDAVFREAKDNTKLQKEYVTLLRALFKSPLTDKMFDLAYMTGILPIKKYGTQSALTDFLEYTMLEPAVFAEYTGFTEDEVTELCKKHGRDFEQTKKWYDGYAFSNLKSVYNPNSIMQSMQSGEFLSYWTRTETYESLKVYIDMDFDGLKQAVIQLLGNGCVTIDTGTFQNDLVTIQSKDDVLTLLIHLGYLAYNSKDSSVYIPNEEVRQEFVRAVKNSTHKEVADMILESDSLLENTINGDETAVAAAIEKVHNSITAPLFYNNEQSLRSVIRFAYISAIDNYVQIQELPSGKGYADLVFIPKKTSDKPCIIIELKWNKSSETALEQIKQNEYVRSVMDMANKVIFVGINYDEKTKKHTCKIEQLGKLR